MPPLPQPFKTAPRRVHRGRRAPVTSSGPAALTLVEASYDAEAVGGPTLRVTFDRPVDIAALVGSAITVEDGANLGLKFNATGAATLESPDTLRVILVEVDSTSVTDVRLSATAASGIAAVDDGGTWAGVTDLELPFNA